MWYLRVFEELKKLDVTVSIYDKATFVKRNSGEVQGIMIVHVDDFLWAGSADFVEQVIVPLRDIFKISKELDTAFKYVGIDLKQTKNLIVVNQDQYVATIKPINIDYGESSDLNRAATASEKKDFQALVGQLNWAVSMSRPDMAFYCCELGTNQAKPKLADLKKANKAVKEIKSNLSEVLFLESGVI